MKKKLIVGAAGAFLLLVAAGTHGNTTKQPITSGNNTGSTTQTKTTITAANPAPQPKVIPVCDGTTVTSDCQVDNVQYKTYIFHPAVAEKSHNETSTTYQKKVSGYCTLCNDDTYSPSCAQGRGACSHHGGVQDWNAPQYETVAVQNTKTIVDTPAQAASYDKVIQ